MSKENDMNDIVGDAWVIMRLLKNMAMHDDKDKKSQCFHKIDLAAERIMYAAQRNGGKHGDLTEFFRKHGITDDLLVISSNCSK